MRLESEPCAAPAALQQDILYVTPRAATNYAAIAAELALLYSPAASAVPGAAAGLPASEVASFLREVLLQLQIVVAGVCNTS